MCTACSKALVHFYEYFQNANHGHGEDDNREHNYNPIDSDSSSSSNDLRRFPTVSDVFSLQWPDV